MSDSKWEREQEIASQFSSFNSTIQKKELINSIDEKVNIAKIQSFLETDSEKIEFLRLYYGKDKFFNQSLRRFKKKRKNIVNELRKVKGDYKIAKTLLNPLRKEGETLLRNEAIEIASRKEKKYEHFFTQLQKAEYIANQIKESNLDEDILEKVLSRHREEIKNDEILSENLKDLFENDEALSNVRSTVDDFFITNVDGEKTIKDVISDAEERILSGDIENVYQEVERTEKIISQNTGQALIDVFNAIHSMNVKKMFVNYINDNEKETFAEKDISALTNKSEEYRNIDLPKKWEEMNRKLKFTGDVKHYKAWYFGLEQGRYKGIVTNIKDYITKEIVKKILNKIINDLEEKNTTLLSIFSFLDGKEKKLTDLKAAFKNFLSDPGVQEYKDKELLKYFETFMSYYFFINYDLYKEKQIFTKIFDDLSKENTNHKKLSYLQAAKNNFDDTLQDSMFKTSVNTIMEKLTKLFSILSEKEPQEAVIPAADEEEPTVSFDSIIDNPDIGLADIPDGISFDMDDNSPAESPTSDTASESIGEIPVDTADLTSSPPDSLSMDAAADTSTNSDNTDNSAISTINFLDELHKEMIESEDGPAKLKAHLIEIEEEKVVDVVNAMSFDPRFNEHYGEVEEYLYEKNWGKSLGLIAMKVKKIENEMGMQAAEDYLEDLEQRAAFHLGPDSFFVQKIRNMKENLIQSHQKGAKKLRYLKEKMDGCKNAAEKIIELQKLSKDPEYKGVFGTVKNLERILIRDNFEEIYEKIKQLPFDTQKALLLGIKDDLNGLFKYEPDMANTLNNYIVGISMIAKKVEENPVKSNDNEVNALINFEKGDLPLVDLTDVMDIDAPTDNKYSAENIERKIKRLSNGVTNGEIQLDDLEDVLSDINKDISLFKIGASEESLNTIEEAKKFIYQVDESIQQAKRIDDLKKNDNVEDVVAGIMMDTNLDPLEQIQMMQNVLNSKHFTLEEKANAFTIAAEKSDIDDTRSQMMEVVQVLRRIDDELKPLANIENKISILNNWIDNDYSDKDHIKEILYRELKELSKERAREGGLLRDLLDNLDKASDKVTFLTEKMNDPTYWHLVPRIKSLLDNIKNEDDITREDITEEWMAQELEQKSDDEKLGWLKLRKYWNKYDEHGDFIDKEIKKQEKKLNLNAEKPVIIYQDIIDLANAALAIQGQKERQTLIQSQWVKNPDVDALFKSQRKMLFYLLGSKSENPKIRIQSLIDRVTLSTSDKQKYLQLLKRADMPTKGSLKTMLDISDEIIAFFSLLLLNAKKGPSVRIKYLERFKTADDEKTTKYKDQFDITDQIINDVIRHLRAKYSVQLGETKESVTVDRNTPGYERKADKGEKVDSLKGSGLKDKEKTLEAEAVSTDNTDEKPEEESTTIDEIKKTPEEESAAADREDSPEEEPVATDGMEEVPEEEPTAAGGMEEVPEEEPTAAGGMEEMPEEEPAATDDMNEVSEEEPAAAGGMEKVPEEEPAAAGGMEEVPEEEPTATDGIEEVPEEEPAAAGGMEEVSEEEPTATGGMEEVPEEEPAVTGGMEEIPEEEASATGGMEEVPEEEPAAAGGVGDVNEAEIAAIKVNEIPDASKERITAHIEEQAKFKADEIREDAREKTRAICDNDKIDKFQSVLRYLSTCYPEAIPQIVETEILPILQNGSMPTYSLLKSVNDAIFIKAVQGKDVEDNLKFLAKNLSKDNLASINKIVTSIQKLWKAEAVHVQKQEKESEEIIASVSSGDASNGRGLTSILSYLKRVNAADIFAEMENRFLINIKEPKMNKKLKLLNDALKEIYNKGGLDEGSKKFVFEQLEVDGEVEKLFNEVAEKLLAIRIPSEKELTAAASTEQKKQPANESNSKTMEKTEKKEEKKPEIEEEPEEPEEPVEDISKSLSIPPTLIDAVVNLNKFVKPHLYILEVARRTPDLNENDYPVDTRRQIIDTLSQKNKIFTYDGTTYIGTGHIYEIVHQESIPKDEMAMFAEKLTAFLDNFPSKRAKFRFLGVKDEMEFRKLNFVLDKYNVDRSGGGGGGGRGGGAKKEKASEEKDKEKSKNKEKQAPTKKSRAEAHKDKIKESIQKRENQQKARMNKMEAARKKQKEFLDSYQKNVLSEAQKEINKKLRNLIKAAGTKQDIDAIYKNYFGKGEQVQKNLLGLCYELGQVVDIIKKDKSLFARLSFDKVKIKGLYEARKKKLK